MKITYRFILPQQIASGIVSFLVAALVTFLFDKQANWALAVAVGIGTFFTSGLYRKTGRSCN